MNISILPIRPQIFTSKINLNSRDYDFDFDVDFDSFEYKKLYFTKAESIPEAQAYAMTKFGIDKMIAPNLSVYNRMNRLFTLVYNETEGKAEFPPTVVAKNEGYRRYTGCCDSDEIVVSNDDYIEETLLHELGHYNHQKNCMDYWKMGKPSEINEAKNPDFSIYNKFIKDKTKINVIRKNLRGYATSSPDEFVAEMFKAMIRGKKLDTRLFDYYDEYEGPFSDIFRKKYHLETD